MVGGEVGFRDQALGVLARDTLITMFRGHNKKSGDNKVSHAFFEPTVGFAESWSRV